MKKLKLAFIAGSFITICTAFITTKNSHASRFRKYAFMEKKSVCITGTHTTVVTVKTIPEQTQDNDYEYTCDKFAQMICSFEADSLCCNSGISETEGSPFFLASDVDPTTCYNVVNIIYGEFIDLEFD